MNQERYQIDNDAFSFGTHSGNFFTDEKEPPFFRYSIRFLFWQRRPKEWRAIQARSIAKCSSHVLCSHTFSTISTEVCSCLFSLVISPVTDRRV
jgi:hypothetical protein